MFFVFFFFSIFGLIFCSCRFWNCRFYSFESNLILGGRWVIFVLFICSELSFDKIFIFFGRFYNLLLLSVRDCKIGNSIFGFFEFIGVGFEMDVIEVG